MATFLSSKRDRKSAKRVFKMAVKEAEFYPKIVVTDKFVLTLKPSLYHMEEEL